MTEPRRRSRPPQSRVWPVLLIAAALAAALVLGIAIGRALADGPQPAGTRTDVRTLQPQPLPPAARTVTVTVTTG